MDAGRGRRVFGRREKGARRYKGPYVGADVSAFDLSKLRLTDW